MHRFRELKIWQTSRQLVKEVYKIADVFPNAEMYGLTSQIKRAVVSISSNIAEGAGRETNKEFCRFLDIANGSAFEVETQLILATDLEFVPMETVDLVINKLHDLQNMIYGFKKYLNNKS